MPVSLQAKAQAYQFLKFAGMKVSGSLTRIIREVSDELNAFENIGWPDNELVAKIKAQHYMSYVVADLLVHTLVQPRCISYADEALVPFDHSTHTGRLMFRNRVMRHTMQSIAKEGS